MTLVLNDNDVIRLVTPTEAVAVMEGVFRAKAQGNYAGAPRWELPYNAGSSRLVFTVGAVPEGVGFRAYVRGKVTHDDQVVVVWDGQTGALKGVVVGEILGAMRTGAIGGVAAKHLTASEPLSLALIGTGRQAYTQLRSIAAVRTLKKVHVYSRTREHLVSFCDDMAHIIPNLDIFPAENAEAAVTGADIVIGATTSKTPVIKGEWLKPGAYVSTLGPKGATQRELDADVVAKADFIVTDSPDQCRSFPDGLITDGTDKTLHDLSDVISGVVPKPGSGITLFISAGLAGTEVALASRLMEKLQSSTSQ